MGLLRYTEEDGFHLEIPCGILGKITQFFNRVNHSERAPIVLGKLRNGKTVTLVDVVMTSGDLNFPGAGREEHKSSLGFIGDIESVANPRIDRLHVTYSHLRDWVMWHPSELTFSLEQDQLGNNFDFHYNSPASTVMASGDGWRIMLVHIANIISPSIQGFNLNHDCELILELDEPLALDEVEERFLTPLWLFLSFCLDRRTYTREIKVCPSGQDKWLEIGNAQSKAKFSDKIVTEPFMLLSMSQLSGHTAELLSHWLEFKGDERRAISLLVGINNDHSSIYVDLGFLVAAQALEAMSRVDAKENELDDDEFSRRLSVVVSSIEDKTVRKWAKWKLKYANSRSANELLQELFESIGEYANILAPNRQQFLKDYRDNRNFYTHRDDRRTEQVLEGNELYVLTQGIVCLLKAAVLRRLGFSQQQTHSLMDDCQGCLEWRFRVSRQYSQPEVVSE